MNDDIQILHAVNKHFDALLNEKSAFKSVFTKLMKHGDVLLFGGAVRDILACKKPKDYDFVVAFKSSCLEEILTGFTFSKNRFDGYKFIVDNIKIDIWSIDDTWAFRNKFVSLSPENLTETVFLNIDSIAVNLCQGNVYANKYREAIKKNLLDIILEQNPFPELCVLRALIFKCTSNIKMSKNLKEYIINWKYSIDKPADRLCTIQRKGGGKMLSRNQIIEQMSQF